MGLTQDDGISFADFQYNIKFPNSSLASIIATTLLTDEEQTKQNQQEGTKASNLEDWSEGGILQRGHVLQRGTDLWK